MTPVCAAFSTTAWCALIADGDLTPDPRDARIAALEAALLGPAADALERLAFSWPAPNPHTPQVVQWCIEARAAIRSGASQRWAAKREGQGRG